MLFRSFLWSIDVSSSCGTKQRTCNIAWKEQVNILEKLNTVLSQSQTTDTRNLVSLYNLVIRNPCSIGIEKVIQSKSLDSAETTINKSRST